MHCAKQLTQDLLYHYTAQRDWHHCYITSPVYCPLPEQVICLSALRHGPLPFSLAALDYRSSMARLP